MPTPRTRKTAAADTEDKIPDAAEINEPAEAAENKAATADTEIKTPEAEETKAPDVAPLEPPAEPEPIPEPEFLTTAQQLLPATIGNVVDEATGEPPADPDAVFVPVPPYGTTFRCTARLIEHVGMGAYDTPATRLLVPVGAQLKRQQMEKVVARLRAQLTESAE
ncbi:hypothetical protein ACPCSC_30480 [Streptomyces lavendulocolor]|uniref:hypothetical protein n=1 Tax=Streptomyces lavendulocolor TaxID=67316 RepID=UPI003C2BE975